MSQQMTCVVLVAGHQYMLEQDVRESESSQEVRRLKGLPKALLPVPNRHGGGECTVLDLWWKELKERRQFGNVYLITNADKYKYFERWATASDFPLENIINDGSTTQGSRIGAAGDLNLAIQTKGIQGDVMVVSGDMLTVEDFDISGVKRFFDSKDGDLCIYYDMDPSEKCSTRGMVTVDDTSKQITAFKEKPAEWPSRQAAVVFACFKAETVQNLLPGFLKQNPRNNDRGFGKLLEYIVARSKVFGMKVPTNFSLIGPCTSLSEYHKVIDSMKAHSCSRELFGPSTTRAYARVGLLGNPSDGFNGKTISLSIENFWAEVTIRESERLRLLPHAINDPSEFGGLNDLFAISQKEGYVGGLRLMQAACKKFYEHCSVQGIALAKRNFTLSYDTNIPRQVGLAGSSCIVVACFKTLMRFFGLTYHDIPKPVLPSLVLSVETDELYIAAGLQDRVVQVYEGLVYMDFSKDLMDKQGYGAYRNLTVRAPPLFLMYATDPSDSGKIHSDVKLRWKAGDEEVVDAMRQFAEFTDKGCAALESGERTAFGELMDANFNLRRKLYGDQCLGSKNLAMAARERPSEDALHKHTAGYYRPGFGIKRL
eukprot:gene4524-7005_t